MGSQSSFGSIGQTATGFLVSLSHVVLGYLLEIAGWFLRLELLHAVDQNLISMKYGYYAFGY